MEHIHHYHAQVPTTPTMTRPATASPRCTPEHEAVAQALALMAQRRAMNLTSISITTTHPAAPDASSPIAPIRSSVLPLLQPHTTVLPSFATHFRSLTPNESSIHTNHYKSSQTAAASPTALPTLAAALLQGSEVTSPQPGALPSPAPVSRRSVDQHQRFLIPPTSGCVRANKAQLKVLESIFDETPMPSTQMHQAIADRIGMTKQSVRNWFQNQRAKVRRSATDGDMLAAQKVNQLNQIQHDRLSVKYAPPPVPSTGYAFSNQSAATTRISVSDLI
ncbi:hypothetical protein BDR26DRAFT_890888 [Obelidium mucronatum]|nr:hypothetical protein BDR26DRAFT_890888 [Obelidium mucronatum]